jgi:D-glycero-alpha-D-manno-heptose-7-phosphate kinase|tara:strand:- start:159 stop:1151 length:993 start_codon:yes stop_codon:yes gene_type:complete
MIISRTPFRISFFGGGTDYPEWYKENGGAVLSTSINKFSYITARYLPPFFDYKYRIRYYQREETNSIKEIQHPSVKNCLQFLKFKDNLDLVHHADLPARGGLGSSSTFTVGLLHATYSLQSKMIGKRQLAMNAIHIEQNLIKESVGSQDQVAAAFGGLNKIEFGGPKEFTVKPISIEPERVKLLESNLMLFFTGFSRTASNIASEQIKTMHKRKAELIEMHESVDQAIEIMTSNQSMDDFGRLMGEQWQNKKKMTDLISNSDINDIYSKGIKAGAIGGKLLGAGGGGFILFYVPKDRQKKVKNDLKNLLYVPFSFDFTGSQIIYYSDTRY